MISFVPRQRMEGKGTLDSEINQAKELRHEWQSMFKELCKVLIWIKCEVEDEAGKVDWGPTEELYMLDFKLRLHPVINRKSWTILSREM